MAGSISRTPLPHLEEHQAADKTMQAITAVLEEKQKVTYDLEGNASTSEMADAIIEKLPQ